MQIDYEAYNRIFTKIVSILHPSNPAVGMRAVGGKERKEFFKALDTARAILTIEEFRSVLAEEPDTASEALPKLSKFIHVSMDNLRVADWVDPAKLAAVQEPSTGPTVGQIVHYTSRGSKDGICEPEKRAAIITRIEQQRPGDDQPKAPPVSLCVIGPDGLFFHTGAEYSSDEEPGFWSWPEASL